MYQSNENDCHKNTLVIKRTYAHGYIVFKYKRYFIVYNIGVCYIKHSTNTWCIISICMSLETIIYLFINNFFYRLFKEKLYIISIKNVYINYIYMIFVFFYDNHRQKLDSQVKHSTFTRFFFIIITCKIIRIVYEK